MNILKKIWTKYLGITVLAATMLSATVYVAVTQLEYEAPDTTTIRICHWQLEAGFREALQDLIDEYEQLYFEQHGEQIRIIQLPISERGYRQYVNTGLIGGTAPDIIEKAKAKTASDPSYVARFFIPLGSYLAEPNPYNKGTDLEQTPWRDTFFDGLQSAYDRTLLDFYHVPFSMFNLRIFYNVDLYRRITGRSEPPQDYADFLAVCELIRDTAEETGQRLIPIAGSQYTGHIFRNRFERPFLFDLISAADNNLDGTADVYETYLAYQQGLWSFHSPELIGSWQCMAEITDHFQDGWLAAMRDDAVFLFVQGNAVMTASGSWDAHSIKKQVNNNFDVGIFDFPIPVNHPKYGEYVVGPVSEASVKGGIPWGITRQSRNQEICVDFLRFCTTRQNNETFNRSITWLPVIRNAELSEELKKFQPRMKGYSGEFAYDISTPVKLIMKGNMWPLYSGRMKPESFADAATEVYERTAVEGYLHNLESAERNVRNLDRITAGLVAQKAAGTGPENLQEKLLQILHSNQEFAYQHAMRKHQLETHAPDRSAGTN